MKTQAIFFACVVLFSFVRFETAYAQEAPAEPTMAKSHEMMAGAVMDSTQGRPLKAELNGENEVGDGDPDGTGEAAVTLNLGQGKVCYELSVENIAEATAAHIHNAPAGQNGSVVIPLDAPSSGSSKGCVEDVSKEVIQGILKDPADYYVNVHNADFPEGAIRGQLSTVALGK